MTAVSDRVAFKELVVSTLNTHFAGTSGATAVKAFFGDPGETARDEMVLLGVIEGNAQTVVFGPAGSDDEFTIGCEILTVGHADEVTAARRAQVLLNEVNEALFQTRFAQSLGGRAFPGKQDGPNSDPPLDGNPAAAIVELTIGCSISVRGS